jgi:RNA ligase
MVTLNDLFDMKDLEVMEKEGFVKIQRHPDFPHDLAIANYTHLTQARQEWNSVTEQTRGLIFNPKTSEVIARPFRKFYNYSEKNADLITGQETVVAYDKLDGSLGIAYPLPNLEWGIATRGSFTSEQAVWATQFMRRNWTSFPFIPDETDLFEIIYPDNRIVVQYDGLEALMYLGTIENETGRFTQSAFYDDLPRAEAIYVGPFEGVFTLKDRDNAEGVVVVTSDGRRVKVKQEEYIRLHRIVSNLSPKYVWEAMGGPYMWRVDEIVRDIPEEHEVWVREVANDLVWQYTMWHTKVSEVYHRVSKLGTRKEIAMKIKGEEKIIQGCIFLGLDNRPYVDLLWKHIKPKVEDNKVKEEDV